MCGITGFFDLKKTSSSRDLVLMTKTLMHRGPDALNSNIINAPSSTVGLGHTRLSIIDLSESGSQPMKFENYWICFNGEVYNYSSIKKDLINLGHSFNGNSDTEVVLHSFIQWGDKCLEKFIGMFAFVVYNETTEDVFCVRDRAGVKPFFYYFNEGLFLFSSELKAFHKHPKFKKEINLSSVAAYMQYGNIPTPHCIFKNCYKLKPGYFLSFNLKNSSLLKTTSVSSQTKYWSVYDFYNKEKLSVSFEEAKKETERILKSSCEYRMVSDVPVGVFLSGGYDSSCVTALLQKDRTQKLKTFTISVPDIGLNEAPYAKEVAKLLGTNHHEIICSHKEAIDLIPSLPYYYDEPFADSSAIPTTLVSKMARKEVTVALSADAGDEVFAGYNRYDYLIRYGKKLNSLPSFVRKSIGGVMNNVSANKIPYLRHKYNFHNRYEKLKTLLEDPSPERIMKSLSEQFTEKELINFLNFDAKELDTAYLSKELMPANYSPLSFMMAIDYQTYLVDDILQKVDRATMTVSLEGREPLLDHRLIEYVAQLPDSFKYHNGIKKHLLREITHQYIPKSLMDRPKMGFAIPIAEWMKNDLKELVEEYINNKRIKEQGIFNWVAVNQLKTDFYNGKKEYDYKVWFLLMFQMWYDKWMK